MLGLRGVLALWWVLVTMNEQGGCTERNDREYDEMGSCVIRVMLGMSVYRVVSSLYYI